MQKVSKQLIYLLPAMVVILADQWLKKWILATLPLYTTHQLWPGVVELCYVQNTGAAFSMFSEHTWILSLISAAAALAMLVLLLRRTFPNRLGQIALSCVLGGAVGNLIDRVFLGYVVDMFSLQFMDFAIFNIADIGVTVGGVLFCLYLVLSWKQEEKAPARDVQQEIKEAVSRAEEGDAL